MRETNLTISGYCFCSMSWLSIIGRSCVKREGEFLRHHLINIAPMFLFSDSGEIVVMMLEERHRRVCRRCRHCREWMSINCMYRLRSRLNCADADATQKNTPEYIHCNVAGTRAFLTIFFMLRLLLAISAELILLHLICRMFLL